MGPSVKFVSAVKDEIFKKMGVNFNFVKKTELEKGGAQWAKMGV